MSLTGIFNSHLIMAAAVARFGTEEQKRKFLPKFASGEVRGGLALTEPDCGTDLSAVRTRALKRGDHYVVNGTKTWISNGIQGSAFAVLVRTDPDAHPARKGLSMFVMEKGPGFKPSRKLEKLGYKGIDSAELVFEDFKVPAANLIGEEGQGFYLAVSGLELGRINVAARGVGIAKSALDEAVRIHGGYGYSKEFPVERLYRDAPLLCIGEGTNEMQRIIIARQLVERNPV